MILLQKGHYDERLQCWRQWKVLKWMVANIVMIRGYQSESYETKSLMTSE